MSLDIYFRERKICPNCAHVLDADKVIEGYKNDNLKRDDFNFYHQLKNTKP